MGYLMRPNILTYKAGIVERRVLTHGQRNRHFRYEPQLTSPSSTPWSFLQTTHIMTNVIREKTLGP